MRTHHQHAGVAARNGFVPPQYRVWALTADDEETWARVPPVPLLSDLRGEGISAREVVLRLAWDPGFLHVRAEIRDPGIVVKPEWGPGSPHFWRQDHVEFRFLPDPERDLDQVQVMAAPGFRCWDNRGLWKEQGRIRTGPGCGEVQEDRSAAGPVWRARLRIPARDVGLGALRAGRAIRGLVAHTRWADGFADIVCSSPAELGFSQAERFGDFVLVAGDGGVSLSGVSNVETTLVNGTGGPVDGTLAVWIERDGQSESFRRLTTQLVPGDNRFRLPLELRWPAFTRYRYEWEGGSARIDLGAVTLRSPAPAVHPPGDVARKHPYLFFDGLGLEAIREKLEHAPFSAMASEITLTEEDLTGRDLPSPDRPVSLDITVSCVNWFRVARETMVRDGEGARRPMASYLWQRQSEPARRAWHDVVRTVQPTRESLAVLVPELNRLLAQRDFYDANAFREINLPPEARVSLARGVASLSGDEVFRLNRILLQSAVECISNFRMELMLRPCQCYEKWLATGDERLIRTATQAVRAALTHTILGPETHLHEGGASSGLALAYDAFHPHLSDGDRQEWRALMNRLLDLYLHTVQLRSWTVTTIANANPVGNAGGGLLALALWDEDPGRAGEALRMARQNVRAWLDYCHGEDGGNTEGVQYWNYGMENFLRFAVALERVAGTGDGFLEHPAVRNAMNMIRVALCNDGALHGVNDTIPMPIGGNIAWFAAGHSGDRLGLWYGDHAARFYQRRQRQGKPTPYRASLVDALLFRPAVPECVDPPPLPECFHLESIEYSVIRSGARFDGRWTAGLKGSRPPYTHHNQADTGSLYIDLRGERMVIDPGYYKPEPMDHGVPLIAGRGPVCPAGWTGHVLECTSRGGCRYVAVDSTGAYEGEAARVVRHLVMAGEEALVLLDDIAAEGAVTAQYPCGGVTERLSRGRGVTVRGDRAVMRIELFLRAEVALALQPERSLKDTHWGYYFADCRLFPVACEYRPVEDDPLITVFTDATGGDAGRVVVDRGRDRRTVVLPSGAAVVFGRDASGWQWVDRDGGGDSA